MIEERARRLLGRVAGLQDHLQHRVRLAQFADDLLAGHAVRVEVEQQQVDVGAGQQRQRLLAVVRDQHAVAFALEQRAGGVEVGLVVVGEEDDPFDAHGAARTGAPASAAGPRERRRRVRSLPSGCRLRATWPSRLV